MATAEKQQQKPALQADEYSDGDYTDDYDSDEYLSENEGKQKPQQSNQRRQRQRRRDDDYDDDVYYSDEYSDEYSDDDDYDQADNSQAMVKPGGRSVAQPNNNTTTISSADAGDMTAPKGSALDEQDGLKLKLELNLEIEVELKAHIHGDLTLSLL
ncbi:hypothetical protein BDW42DRAFT_41502 [Aspergillus taichungensis]|uniref:Uncharacterized protein n=1 Tax=Aspergillus taichungensis TaxID=482145 RepID=A0A2J5I412_9EURO|nr:hypothetical protein BDW42DRAFT_41502 [Aspergillus taichungensis]